MEENAIVVHEAVSLGAIQASGPQDVIARAAGIAQELAKIIKSQKLYTAISGRNFVRVEGWSTMGAMLGIVPREVSVIEHESGDFEATVELVRAGDGAVIGRASAIVGSDENTWNKRPRYARRSMAVTRATGKAFRLGFSWIVTLAGFEPTPAEEMEGVVDAQVVNVQPPDPEPKPQEPSYTSSSRPYPPETVKAGLQKKAEKHREFTPTPAQENLLRYSLELCFAGQPSESVTDKRHTLLGYLTDGITSTKKVSGKMFKAIIEDWLKITQDEGGEYHIDPIAAREAQAIVTAALKDEGQSQLF